MYWDTTGPRSIEGWKQVVKPESTMFSDDKIADAYPPAHQYTSENKREARANIVNRQANIRPGTLLHHGRRTFHKRTLQVTSLHQVTPVPTDMKRANKPYSALCCRQDTGANLAPYSRTAGPNKVPRSLCQKERGCWCTRCRQSVPHGHTAVSAYVADLLKRGCYKAEEASAKQLLQTLSVVMQRPAAIAGPVNFGKGRAPSSMIKVWKLGEWKTDHRSTSRRTPLTSEPFHIVLAIIIIASIISMPSLVLTSPSLNARPRRHPEALRRREQTVARILSEWQARLHWKAPPPQKKITWSAHKRFLVSPGSKPSHGQRYSLERKVMLPAARDRAAAAKAHLDPQWDQNPGQGERIGLFSSTQTLRTDATHVLKVPLGQLLGQQPRREASACATTLSSCSSFVDGSLEVKLPTIWTDEKQSREEAERRERVEERRVEEKELVERKIRRKKSRRERVRRKKMQMREKVGKSQNTVFRMICGSGGSKSRVAKAAGAEPAGQTRD